MRFVVTGGAGFIGSHIVEDLVKRKHEVVILDNLFSGKIENIAQFLGMSNVTLVKGSVTDLPLLQKTFDDVDGIFHEAAIASVPRSVTNPLETHEVNLSGTLNVLIAARKSCVNKVVFASSAAVYGNDPALPKQEDMTLNTLSPYAVSKLSGEYYCSVFSQLYGVQYVALRYFNVFGSRQDPRSPYSGVITKFITNILNDHPLIISGDGTQTRDFVYVKDVVQANILAMKSNKQGVFNVAYGNKINLLELAGMIQKITGNTVPITFGPSVSGDVQDSLADINRSKKILGYAPKFTIKSGLKETITWFQEQS